MLVEEEELIGVTLDGVWHDIMNIQNVSWNGSRSYEGFCKAKTLKIALKDGSRVAVEASGLDYDSSFWLTELLFPG